MEHHHTHDIEQQLTDAGIRPTAVRLLVLRAIAERDEGVFSLQDLSDRLPTMDKSSLFRTLTLFADKQLLHPIDDGSGMQKYCIPDKIKYKSNLSRRYANHILHY